MGHISGTNLGITLLALTAACGGSTPATTGGGGATASVGGTAQSASSAAAGVGGTGGVAQATASASVTVGAGGSGGGEFLCNPAAAPGSIYETTADMFGSAGPASMCKYRGDVMLIVNTAAI